MGATTAKTGREATFPRRVLPAAALAAGLAAASALGGCAAPAVRARGRPARTPWRRVAPGVRLAGRPFGGLDAAEAERALALLAPQLAVPAQDARIDPENGGLLVATDGLQLDVARTLARLLAAAPGTRVQPVLRLVPPAVTAAALPPAPIYHAPRDRPAVALVVNVAWGETYLPALLAALRAGRAPATFCLVGRWAETHAAEVQAIRRSGREAGTPYAFCNHGYRDRGWRGLDEAEARASIAAADRVIAALTGERPRYFSPHRGEWTPAVLRASRAEGHELVLWSVDTIDWRHPTPQVLLERVLGRVRPGDIVLMHPTQATVQALPALIAGIRAKGLHLVTLDQLLASRPLP